MDDQHRLDRNGLEVLDRSECIRLLRTVSVCRIAVTLSSLPAILPVNFALMDEEIVMRTAPGTKLTVALRNTVVAVEADSFDEEEGHGWSVLVRGRSRELTRPEELEKAHSLHLFSWAGDLDHFVAVQPHHVSGRRIRPHAT